MRIYPAIRAEMGDWHYYIVRMKMREVANEIKFASDIYEDRTLSDAIQRALDDNRVKKSLVSFLARRPDRFFSSLVVAAIGGDPSWYAVEMDPSVVPAMIANSKQLRDSFGILSFDQDPRYYALDGQHRLKAIQLLVEGKADLPAPDGFDDEEISVLVVLRGEDETDDAEWRKRYRRLFSSLNRYAKATDRDTNIIMDEDDVFAIITRRLITEHPFFQAPGKERLSFRVQTKGKNLSADASHFISLQTLYAINQTLLSTQERLVNGWANGETNLKQFMQYRPEEELIDKYFEEIVAYWDGILDAFPELQNNPPTMRCHELPDPNPENYQDHLVFWTIGQELFAELVRDVLDKASIGGGSDVPSSHAVAEALTPLRQVNLELHDVPWRHLLLVGPLSDSPSWRMRSEDRKAAIEVSKRLMHWILGFDPLNDEELNGLRREWQTLLYPAPPASEAEKLWSRIINLRGSGQKK